MATVSDFDSSAWPEWLVQVGTMLDAVVAAGPDGAQWTRPGIRGPEDFAGQLAAVVAQHPVDDRAHLRFIIVLLDNSPHPACRRVADFFRAALTLPDSVLFSAMGSTAEALAFELSSTPQTTAVAHLAAMGFPCTDATCWVLDWMDSEFDLPDACDLSRGMMREALLANLAGSEG
jgi:hypothetical protein